MRFFTLSKHVGFALAFVGLLLFTVPSSAGSSYKHSYHGYKAKGYYNKHYSRKSYSGSYGARNYGYGFKFKSYHNRHYSHSSNRYRNYRYKNYGYHNGYRNGQYRHGYKAHRRYNYSYVSPYTYGSSRGYSSHYYDDPFARYRKENTPHYDESQLKKGEQYESSNDVSANSQCYHYTVTANGGQAGFRFQHDKENFKQIGASSYASEICGYRSVEFELSKLDPTVDVSIEIGGRVFHYPANSGHDRLINQWHRKYFSVKF